jgi:hypothetical protein
MPPVEETKSPSKGGTLADQSHDSGVSQPTDSLASGKKSKKKAVGKSSKKAAGGSLGSQERGGLQGSGQISINPGASADNISDAGIPIGNTRSTSKYSTN